MKISNLIANSVWVPGKLYQEGCPKITVILPTFRRGSSGLFLKSAHSVLNQSCRDIELIIIDDASTDGTASQIDDLMTHDGRVSCIRHQNNIGLPAVSEFEAYLKARGEYLAFAFDDDEFYLDALEKLLEKAESGNLPFVFGYVDMLVPDLVAGGETVLKDFGRDSFQQNTLRSVNQISNNAVLVNKLVIEDVGFYDPHIVMTRLCDWDLWRRIGEKYILSQVDVAVGLVRGPVTGDSLGNTYVTNFWLSEEWMNLNRNDILKPSNLFDYDVESIPNNVSSATRFSISELSDKFKNKWWSSSVNISNDFGIIPDGVILVVAHEYDACVSLYFDRIPQPYHSRIRVIKPSHWLVEEMVDASAVIFVRDLFGYPEWVKCAKKIGVPFYWFIDDNFFELGKTYPIFSRYSNLSDSDRKNIASVRGVIASTSALANYVRNNGIHDDAFVFPPICSNPSKVDYIESDHKVAGSEMPVIAFFGNQFRYASLNTLVVPALVELARKWKFRLLVPDDCYLDLSACNFDVLKFKRTLDISLGIRNLIDFGVNVLVHPGRSGENDLYKTENILLNAFEIGAYPIVSSAPQFSHLENENFVRVVDSDVESWIEALSGVFEKVSEGDYSSKEIGGYLKKYDGVDNINLIRCLLIDNFSPGFIEREIRFRNIIQSERFDAFSNISSTEEASPIAKFGLQVSQRRQPFIITPRNIFKQKIKNIFGRSSGKLVAIVGKRLLLTKFKGAGKTPIKFKLATFARAFTGELDLFIFDSLGNVVHKIKIPNTKISDNSCIEFMFDLDVDEIYSCGLINMSADVVGVYCYSGGVLWYEGAVNEHATINSTFLIA